jgi:hypothetical protein
LGFTDQPVPAIGAVLGCAQQLENMPEDFQKTLEQFFVSDHGQRVAQTLELMAWVGKELRSS